MIRSSRAALAAMLLLGAAPILAQMPSPASTEQPPQVQAALAFLAQIGEATTVQQLGMKKLLDAKPLIDTMTSPTGIKAGAPRLRAIIGEARKSVEQSDAMLAKIDAPAELRMGALTAASMLAEARGQNAKGVKLLGDFSTYLSAVERGDRATAVKLAPRLIEGSFFMIDSTRMILTGRQAAIPATQSIHQGLGVGIELYRLMGAAGRGWLGARFEGKGDAAASPLRAQLAAVARSARDISKTGRDNLQRELRELDARVAGATLNAEDKELMARMKRAFAEKEKLFGVGDDLARLSDANADVNGARLAAQATPELLGDLTALEARFHAVVAAQAAIATKAN